MVVEAYRTKKKKPAGMTGWLCRKIARCGMRPQLKRS
jgi:hypothetical protein